MCSLEWHLVAYGVNPMSHSGLQAAGIDFDKRGQRATTSFCCRTNKQTGRQAGRTVRELRRFTFLAVE